MQVKQLHSITEISAYDWNALAGDDYPFIRHEFLAALETSGSVTARTGWLPRHQVVHEGETLVALQPLYLKAHSLGEFVFDQAWASAYRRYGLEYYPKWLTSIPFTPCPGSRCAIKAGVSRNEIMRLLFELLKETAEAQGISSWHCLFPNAIEIAEWRALGLLVREGVQYHWFNKGYRDFDDYLDTLTAAKRKMIRRERRKVVEAGIGLRRIPGDRASENDWRIFYGFYIQTYRKNGSLPYLNLEFFLHCAAVMGERMLVVQAEKCGKIVAAALFFVGADTLYGRYWGCEETYDALHFEACYYQGLEFCLENGLKHFDSGAQGEHKIARGFEPVATYSAHWLQNPEFAAAVEDFLVREKVAVTRYRQNAEDSLPFKK